MRIAVRYTRNIRTLAKRIDDENGKRKTMAEARITVELSVLEKISTRVEGDPQTWRRLAQKIGVQRLDDFTRLERKYDGDYPNLRSGLTRALLHGMKREAVSGNSKPGRTPRL